MMSSSHSRSKRRSSCFVSHAMACLGGMIFAMIVFNGWVLHSFQPSQLVDGPFRLGSSLELHSQMIDERHEEHHELHDLAGLDCSAHGGPLSAEVTQELVYWRDLPLDNEFVSPLKSKVERQYLTFEPDGGGWNNIRMSMETVLAMAVAMGRVLVLPPAQKMYLLGHKNVGFGDFFPLKEIAKELAGLEIVTMEQFLNEVGGKVADFETGKPAPLPKGRTNWDGKTDDVKETLNPWLRSIAANPDWDPEECIAAFPKSTDPEDYLELQHIFDDIQEKLPNPESFVGRPTPVNASTTERMLEFMATRQRLCLYTPELLNAKIVHFSGKAKMSGRLLVHFYAFLFFQDYKSDLWMKRFVRDHVRYTDDVQCAAARIIEAVRKHSNDKGNKGIYDAFHIRRGDFQYKKTRVEASAILEIAMDQIPQGTTVYVGTDERHKSFFKAMTDYWDVLFLDDFADLLGGIDKTHFGMIDQLVTSKGRTFFGCWFSTFTSYITRLRGYHSQLNEAEGHEMGLLPTTFYYALKEHKTLMQEYWPIKKLFYAREFPAAWRTIDTDES